MESAPPAWTLVVNNGSVRAWRAFYETLPASDRPLMLRVTAACPSAIVGDTTSSQLAFRRLQDLFTQASKSCKMHVLSGAAEQATRELVVGNEEGCPDPLARFAPRGGDGALKVWSDRVEELVRAQGIEPTFRAYG